MFLGKIENACRRNGKIYRRFESESQGPQRNRRMVLGSVCIAHTMNDGKAPLNNARAAAYDHPCLERWSR